MRALLLAAGMGTRLRPITDTLPKCLVPIHGRPLLDYWLDLLTPDTVERIMINTHYLAQAVEAHVAASPERARIDLTYEPILLGTGGTIAANRAWLGDEPFLVCHADNLTDLDVAALVAAHATRPAGCLITMLAFRTDDPSSCGILGLDDRGVVTAFHEKVEHPPGDLANAAVYLMEPQVADFIVALGRPYVDLSTEVIPRFLGRMFALEHGGYHRDIGAPASLRRAEREFRPRPRI
jgi:mannose-1-phosphate guanylyltransferase